MASDRRLRKFVRRWRRRYPIPVEWVDDRANKQLRRSEAEWLAQFEGAASLRRRDVRSLIAWKFASDADRTRESLGGIATPGAWGHARRCIVRALAASSASTALEGLLGETGGVPGWGPEMASVVLSVCRPNLYTLADLRAARTLKALDFLTSRSEGEFSRLDWMPYLNACRNLAEQSGAPLRAVYQALWAAADDAPKMRKRGRQPNQRPHTRGPQPRTA